MSFSNFKFYISLFGEISPIKIKGRHMMRVKMFLNCVAAAASSTQPQRTIEPGRESARVIDNFWSSDLVFRLDPVPSSLQKCLLGFDVGSFE